MSKLSIADIDERVALYLDYRDAVIARDEIASRIPVDPPDDLTLLSTQMLPADCDHLTGICVSAWPSLRKAALIAANRRVEEAEKRVIAFEAGEEV